MGEPQTQLLKWSTNNKHRNHIKHININSRNDGNESNISVLSNQSKCESTLQERCGNYVHSSKDCICPFTRILYVLCVSYAVVVVGVDNAPSYGLVVD